MRASRHTRHRLISLFTELAREGETEVPGPELRRRVDEAHARRLHAEGRPLAEIARILDVPVATVARLVGV